MKFLVHVIFVLVLAIFAPALGEIDPRQSSNCTCGQLRGQQTNRIVNGVVAQPNEIPWRVALYMVSPVNPLSIAVGDYSFFCGATILNEEWVMTAAHCMDAAITNRNHPVKVAVGQHDLQNTVQVEQNMYEIAEFINHPQWNPLTFDNDISLLRMKTPIPLGDTVSPICLPYGQEQNDFPEDQILASGWGVTRENGGDSGKELNKVTLDTITNIMCQLYYMSRGSRAVITNNMICTYTFDDRQQRGKDTCQGDSGGSIDKLVGDNYMAVGIVSFGEGCARQRAPGVYARVTRFLDFIHQTTGVDSFCRP